MNNKANIKKDKRQYNKTNYSPLEVNISTIFLFRHHIHPQKFVTHNLSPQKLLENSTNQHITVDPKLCDTHPNAVTQFQSPSPH